MIPTLASAPHDLQMLKLYLLDFTGLGRDALHIYAGLTVFLGVRLLWRWRGGWFAAWLAALALALSIEWLDIRAWGDPNSPRPDPNNWHDIWNTMVWPTVLLLVGPWLQPRGKNQPESGDFADQSFEQPAPV
ncbi:MAG TPA: hypothetical protein VGN36_08355 [Sphingorhabdus sp.]|jgi:hypothetical protein|nr:hypothetical protein [Sphingorhabdus sp.]